MPYRGNYIDNLWDQLIDGLLDHIYNLETDFGARIQVLEATSAQSKQLIPASNEAKGSVGPQNAILFNNKGMQQIQLMQKNI